MSIARISPARVAVASFAVFVAATLVAAAATPGYDSVRENMSALASLQVPHAWIMLIGFAGLSCSAVAAGIALRRRLTGRSGALASAGLLLVGAGIACAGAAREDCSTALDACRALEASGAVSGHHMVHELVSGVTFLLLVGIAFLLARALRATPGAAGLRARIRMGAVASAITLIVFATGVAGPAGGVVQRAFVALAFGLPLLVAVRLERLAVVRADTAAPPRRAEAVATGR
jgi:hypothetical membrane protein